MIAEMDMKNISQKNKKKFLVLLRILIFVPSFSNSIYHGKRL